MFLDQLTEIWDSGADYVDLIGIQNGEQDIINIVVRQKYMSDDVDDDEEENDETLSDEDINNLI